jgi:hypothetical protein
VRKKWKKKNQMLRRDRCRTVDSTTYQIFFQREGGREREGEREREREGGREGRDNTKSLSSLAPLPPRRFK